MRKGHWWHFAGGVLEVGKCNVKLILVDMSSAENVLFLDVVAKMGILDSEFEPYILPLIRFTRRSINSSRIVNLLMYINDTTWSMEFLIVHTLSSYNSLSGQPKLINLKKRCLHTLTPWKYVQPQALYNTGMLPSRRWSGTWFRQCHKHKRRWVK